MQTKNIKHLALAMAVLGVAAVATPALADTQTNKPVMKVSGGMMGRSAMMRQDSVVMGTVTSIAGSTIILSGHLGFSTSTPASTYTVDATNAKITKNMAAGTISNIVSGDTLLVQGTITGTNVVARIIHDGVLPAMKIGRDNEDKKGQPQNPITLGNGQPVVGGKISAISGNTITITNSGSAQYTINAANAKITQGNSTILLSALKIGDSILVQGNISGNSVTATSISTAGLNKNNGDSNMHGTSTPKMNALHGIGNFFARLFGF